MSGTVRPPEVLAVVAESGQMAVWGLPGAQPHTFHGDELADSYSTLLNLVHEHATLIEGQVWLAARTPDGLWHMAIDPEGRTVPIPDEAFTAEPPPLDALAHGSGLAPAEPTDASPADKTAALRQVADPDPSVRACAWAALANWGDDPAQVIEAELDPAHLAVLADSRLGWVRAGVAGHPRTDTATLALLSDDPDAVVRQALAARMDLPADLVAELAGDPDATVRGELWRNPTAAFLSTAIPVDAPTAAPTVGSAAVVSGASTPDAGFSALATATAAPESRSEGGAIPAPADAAQPRGGAALPGRRRAGMAAGIAAAAMLLAGAGYAVVASATDPPPAAAASGPVVAWNGTWLPAGPDGPDNPTGPVATGFAHTTLGAACAAAHLSVRIDPYAGPASFVPTITDQTYGGTPAALLRATQTRYTAAAAKSGITDGAPIPTSAGRIVGWRVDAWTADRPVTVHLRVLGPDGADLDFRIDVVWTGDDYALVDPTRADTFTTSPADDPTSYRSF